MRALTITAAFGVILGVLFGGMAAAYGLAGLAESLSPGLGRLTNILFLMLLFVMVIATLLTLAERKWSAMMQDRIGPNRARLGLPGLKDSSLFGLPHIAADVLKMLTKEDFVPKSANKVLFTLGPILAFAPVFALFAIVPAGPSVTVGGQMVDMVVATPDFGLLFIFAIASLAVYGTSLAGWSSNNKFALLGGVRASSQMISYEVALGLSLVGMMLAFGTVKLASDPGVTEVIGAAANTLGLTDAQAQYLWRFTSGFDLGVPAWGILLQPVGFVLFFAAAFAETKRAPFDVPEGESEIIGYFVEYSGMKFGMFMISEFVEIVVLSGVLVAIFFGGYHLPFGEEWLRSLPLFQEHGWLLGATLGTVFWIKVLLLCWLQLAIRWTFPRFRYDQIQALGWKILLPAGLANVFLTGALVLWDGSYRMLALVGMLEIGIVAALTLIPRRAAEAADAHAPVPHAARTAHH